jgi:hypothetical protein
MGKNAVMSDESGENDLSMGAHAAGKNSGAAVEVDPARAAKVGATRATAEAAMAALIGGIERPEEASQPSLMLDEVDEQLALFAGPVRHVAEKIDDERRVRGRPKGSQNRNSFRDTLLRMGYRHPGLNLAAIANADPIELAAELSQPYRVASGPKMGELVEASMTPAEALGLILKANAELLPYFESKRPTEVLIEERKLGVMIVGEMKTERGADSAYLSLTEVEKPE